MIWGALQVLVGYVYGHILEYCIHRWVLHPFGTRKGSPFAFHWAKHHKNARRQLMSDMPSGREFIGLGFLLLIHLPLWLIAPWFYLTLIYNCASYFYSHTRSHLDTVWACKHMRHHVDHHMGDQHYNWGVRSDVIDRIMGTRVHGTRYENRNDHGHTRELPND